MASAAFTNTLRDITSTKLRELEDQRSAYRAQTREVRELEVERSAHRSRPKEVRASLDNASRIEKVETLLESITSWQGSGALRATNSVVESKLELTSLRRWLAQAKVDPAFPTSILDSWIVTLQDYIDHSQRRFDCASLFGNLFNEWLASGDTNNGDGSAQESSEEFVPVGRQEMQEQKARLDGLIFTKANVDTSNLQAYLEELFSTPEAEKALDNVRRSVKSFGENLRETIITSSDVEWTIRSLLQSDLLEESKLATLRQFLNNNTILQELASVLNMRLGFGKWSWPAEGLVIEMRRALNGKYRAFTDCDLLDALLVEYIGVKWQVTIKKIFHSLLYSGFWKKPPPLSSKDRIRREVFLRRNFAGETIHNARFRLQGTTFFLSQLSNSVHVRQAYDSDNQAESSTSHASIKQSLLHLLITECNLNLALHDSHTILRTDLEWFGPSLPHQSIAEILKFFGMSDHWLQFFDTFLRMPLRYKEDGASGEVRIRERGTPLSFALSAFCGEVILFVMDIAVNQKTDGLFLYRIHDDLWLWDSDTTKVSAGWKEMNRYADIVGLTFNKSKTGSLTIPSTSSTSLLDNADGLPEGDIRWGFLEFSSSKRRFVISQDDVDVHIKELRRQLASTKSVFGWVNVYNKYQAFFLRNFACPSGKTANCFGTEFVDDAVETLSRIQRELFDQAPQGAPGYLIEMLSKRFGTQDLPSGFIYWPINLGGLGLQNPMIQLLALRQAMSLDTSTSSFDKVKKQDKENYKGYKETFESHTSWATSDKVHAHEAFFSRGEDGLLDFMPYDEYVAYPETTLSTWRQRWQELMEVVRPVRTPSTPYLNTISDGQDFDDTDPYNQWLFGLYAENIMKYFGSVTLVDSQLIPLGLLEIYKSSRVKWDQ